MEVLTRLGRPYVEWIGDEYSAAKIFADWDEDEFYVLVSPAIDRYHARQLENALDEIGLEMLSEEESPAEDHDLMPGNIPGMVWKKIALIPFDIIAED